ncbi:MAG: hypothetical protein Q8P42_02375 [Gallionella sp.]|nr:hypothetical protein [Gallionella sp.]
MQQLDIFSDSASVQRANDLIAALADFEHTAAQLALRNLAAVDPHHAGLPKYRLLCDFVNRWADSCNDPDWPRTLSDITAEEQLIREQIIPAATVMGNTGDELVRKCWLVLAKASERIAITPEHADLFAAELYLRARQFSDAVRTAQRVSGADMRPAVQRWLGLGFYGCGKTKPASEAALRYAWLAPQLFDAFVGEMGDSKLARDWSEFQADLGDLDATWFPAWCAHEKKTGTATLDNLPASDGCAAYRLVMNLAIRERGGLCDEVYEDRARLKQLDESFFAFYMQRRSDLHARI